MRKINAMHIQMEKCSGIMTRMMRAKPFRRSKGGGPVQSAYEVLGVKIHAPEAEVREAYRALARRWHPDRFPEGPERLWAEQKMVEINRVYKEAMQLSRSMAKPAEGQLCDVRHLVELGQLTAARQALMRIAQRTAEWNYLFGEVLYRLGEYKKAALYLGVAVHQSPDNPKYRSAYAAARTNQKNMLGAIKGAFSAWKTRMASR